MSQNTKINTKTSDHDKYITLNNLKDFYKLLNKNFVATEDFYGGIKTGYLTDYSNKKYAVRLENGQAYVEVPWISGTASESENGLMYIGDKIKLNGIEEGANKYVLPEASDSQSGGIKTGYNNGVADNDNKNYPVQLDENNKAYVNVPWKDNNTTYSNATQSAAGLMSADDKTKLDGIDVDANKFILGSATNNNLGGFKTGYNNGVADNDNKNYPVRLDENDKAYVNVPWIDNNTTYSNATQSAAGLMSIDDKTKLDGIDIEANKFILGSATNNNLGGFKTGYNNGVADNDNKNYPVRLDENDKAYVNVPWIDNNTTYNNATQSAAGLMSADDKTKLDGIDVEANKFILGSASAEDLGGIKIGYNGGKADTTNKNYPIQLDEESKAYVNVPWINTTYTFNTGLSTSNNEISLNLINGEKTIDEVSEPTWKTGTDIPENSEYYKCPVCIDKNGNLYVKVPAVKSNLGSDDPSLLNDNE